MWYIMIWYDVVYVVMEVAWYMTGIDEMRYRWDEMQMRWHDEMSWGCRWDEDADEMRMQATPTTSHLQLRLVKRVLCWAFWVALPTFDSRFASPNVHTNYNAMAWYCMVITWSDILPYDIIWCMLLTWAPCINHKTYPNCKPHCSFPFFKRQGTEALDCIFYCCHKFLFQLFTSLFWVWTTFL